MEYVDFELEIGQGTGREYPVAVLDSPGGEAQEVMCFPFDQLALESRLKDLQIALLRSGGTRRVVPTAEENAVQGFGKALFDALFVGEVRSRYDVSYETAARDGLGLRLKLRIQDPQLAALPWEFLYDPRQAEYICLSRTTPLVRYLELPQRIPPLKLTPPLRILGVVASPSDLPALDLVREKERVTRAVSAATARGLVELVWLEGQTWRDLQREMQGGPWHVLHFIGHGSFDNVRDEGLVCLCEDDGSARFLYATELARLLADHRSLRLVVLNACEGARGGGRDLFSSTASILVRRGMPAVLAMQYEITDSAAIELARGFYEAIARGLPVDAAVAEARKAVSFEVENTVEWGTPVLTMRTPDGVLFDIARIPAPVVQPSPTPPAPAVVAAAAAGVPASGPTLPEAEPATSPESPAKSETPAASAAQPAAAPLAAQSAETATTGPTVAKEAPRPSRSLSLRLPQAAFGAGRNQVRLPTVRFRSSVVLLVTIALTALVTAFGALLANRDLIYSAFLLGVWAVIGLVVGGIGALISRGRVRALDELTAGLVGAAAAPLIAVGSRYHSAPTEAIIVGVLAAVIAVSLLSIYQRSAQNKAKAGE